VLIRLSIRPSVRHKFVYITQTLFRLSKLFLGNCAQQRNGAPPSKFSQTCSLPTYPTAVSFITYGNFLWSTSISISIAHSQTPCSLSCETTDMGDSAQRDVSAYFPGFVQGFVSWPDYGQHCRVLFRVSIRPLSGVHPHQFVYVSPARNKTIFSQIATCSWDSRSYKVIHFDQIQKPHANSFFSYFLTYLYVSPY